MTSLRIQSAYLLLHNAACHRLTPCRNILQVSCGGFSDRQRRLCPASNSKVNIQCKTCCIPVNVVSWFNVNSMFGKKNVQYYSTSVDDKSEHCSHGVNIESLVNNLVHKASEMDKMVMTISKSALRKQVGRLLEVGMLEEDIKQIFSLPEHLTKLSSLVELIEVLCQYGFYIDDILHLLERFPDILMKVDQSQFVTLHQDLHNNGFPQDSISSMIIKCPALLTCDLKTKLPMIEELKLLFKKSDTLKLIMHSPDILFHDMSYIHERFNYVFHEMGITQPQMMYSNLFTYPMEHVITRHMFLVRSGYFKKVKKSKGQIDLNPKLDTIIDSTDGDFVKKFGNMTLLDYQAFKALIVDDIVKLEEEED